MKILLCIAFSLCLTSASSVLAQSSWQPQHPGIGFGQSAANQSVQMVSSPGISVKADSKTGQHMVLRFAILNGMHINSHNPRSRFLIPTVLTLEPSEGITVSKIEYPHGADYHFEFSPKDSMSVYTGEFPVDIYLRARRGRYALQGQLRYQACDNRTCSPPKSLPLTLEITAK